MLADDNEIVTCDVAPEEKKFPLDVPMTVDAIREIVRLEITVAEGKLKLRPENAETPPTSDTRSADTVLPEATMFDTAARRAVPGPVKTNVTLLTVDAIVKLEPDAAVNVDPPLTVTTDDSMLPVLIANAC